MLRSHNKNNFLLYLLTITLSVTILSGLILAGSFVSADDTIVSNVAITVPASCTLSGTGMDSHTANINNGTYTTDIGTTTLKAYCNDSEGFAIYAIGYTGEEYGVTNLVGTNTGTTITTGTATTAGNPDISNWAMKLGTITSPTPTYPITIDNSFNNYHAVPSTYTKVAHRDSGTDTGTNAEGSTLTTTYAAYISKTQTADTYNGKVKYTMIHPVNADISPFPIESPSGKICYYPNSTRIEGTMGCQDIIYNSNNFLLASNYSRAGYGFAGWSDTYDYATNPNAHFYGASEMVFIENGQYSGVNSGLSLYAVWIESDGYLQDWNGCSSLTPVSYDSLNENLIVSLSNVTALTDRRDNDTYAVARLADGNCWMIENLRLDSTASQNTDGLLAQGYGTSSVYGNFSGLATAESSNFGSITANSLYYVYNQSGTASVDIGSIDDPASRFPRYSNLNTQNRALNPNDNACNDDMTTGCMYSYGNYYTWPAVIASTIYYDSPTAVDANGKTSETANTSICPSGWRLPYGRNIGNGALSGGFAYLDIAMGGNGDPTETGEMTWNWRKFPNNYVDSGMISFSQLYRYGGFYHSSTTKDGTYSYVLLVDTGGGYPGTAWGYKLDAATVRCVLINT
ncbi:hypothetical protein J6S37_02155 [Candidatus Saccharibacteria bacterium]|nr:hypothetical protein [Candidatus Saccharibacteria bacterium]